MRRYSLGQSELPFTRFEVHGSAVGFLSPDDSLPVLRAYLDRAAFSIHAATSEMDRPSM